VVEENDDSDGLFSSDEDEIKVEDKNQKA